MQNSRWYLPVIYGLSVIIFLQYSGADNWLASQIFQINQAWSWQHAWLLDKIIHKGGRSIVAIWFVVILVATLLAYITKALNKNQRLALFYTVVASTLSILIISGLKQIAMLPCPWDVQGMGGELPYRYLHQLFSSRETGLQCFPAGHASGGYALFSLYFAAQIWRSGNPSPVSRYWLLPAVLIGGLFGIGQQLRGAHFLSHDLTTALLCWLCCRALWFAFSRKLSPVYQARKHSYVGTLNLAKRATINTQGLKLMEKS